MRTIKNEAGKYLMLFLAAVTLFTGCTPPGPRALFKGKKLLEQGRYAEAVERLKIATALLNTNAQAWNYLGLAYHHAGQPGQAERAYQRALALDHDLTEAHYNLGCLWLSENRLEGAKTELTAYTLRRGNSLDGFLKLGTAQLRARELAAAEKTFNDALKLNPQSAEALTSVGLVRVQRQRADEAVAWFKKALKEQPDYSPALLNLAIVEQEYLKDRAAALQHYRAYLALKPVPDNAESIKGIVHELEQEINPTPPPPPRLEQEMHPALPHQNPALAAQPTTNPGPPRMSVAEAAHTPTPPKAPVTNGARTAGSAGAEMAASKPAPVTNAARPAPVTNAPKPTPVTAPPPASNPEVVQAEPVFKAAEDVSTAPPQPPSVIDDNRSVTTSAPATAKQTKPVKKTFLQRMNPLNLLGGETSPQATPAAVPDSAPENGVIGSGRYVYKSPAKPQSGDHTSAERAFAQGLQAQQAQRFPEAVQAYRRAIQLDPAFFDAYYNLGLAGAALGNQQTALTAYEYALALRPESLDARYNFALVLKQANFPVDAANELQKVLSNYPNDSRTHLALGNLYAQQLQQPTKARQHYLKVLETDPRNPQAANIRYWLTDSAK
jgi:tetratricopeptide (TPR) repeat protein